MRFMMIFVLTELEERVGIFNGFDLGVIVHTSRCSIGVLQLLKETLLDVFQKEET